MAGKKKGKKGKSQEEKEQSGSQQQGDSQGQQQAQQGPQSQQQPRGPQPQQQPRGPQPQQQPPAQHLGQSPQVPPGFQRPQTSSTPAQPPQGPYPGQPRQRGPPTGQQPPQMTQGYGEPLQASQPVQRGGGQARGRGRGGRGGQAQQVPPSQVPSSYQQHTPRGESDQASHGSYPGQPRQWGPPTGQQPPVQQTQISPASQAEQLQANQPIQRGGGQARGRGGRAQQGSPAPYQAPPSYEQTTPVAEPAQPVEGGRGRGQGRGRGRGRGGPAGHQPQPTTPTQQLSSPEGSVTGQPIRRPESGQGDTQLVPFESKIKIKPGTKGRPIKLETNHISLNLGKLKTVIHYDVNMVPDIPKKLLRTVFEQFRQRHFPDRFPAFDGRKNAYSPSPLPFKDFLSDEIAIQEDTREKKFKVEIKFANNVDMTPLHDLLASVQTPREAMQVVDIVLRSAPAMSCIPVGRSFFKGGGIVDLGGGMEMYNGFYQSAIRGWKPFLNIDVANKAFPKCKSLPELLPEILSTHFNTFDRQSLTKPLSDQDISTLNSYIRTLKVIYEIPGHPSTRRVYRVNGLDESPRKKKFALDNGQQIDIETYFEKHKNYRLRYPLLPTLWVGAQNRDNKILLPLELCTVQMGQVINRKLTEQQTSSMIKFTATGTDERKRKIMTSLREAAHNSSPTVQEFGFSVGNEFEKLEGRVLSPPSLGYCNNRTVNPRRGVWRGDKFFAGVQINKWTIACVDRRPPNPKCLTDFAESILKNASLSGMFINQPAEKPFDQINGNRVDEIKKYFQVKKEKNYDVIFVVVPNQGMQYGYVKKAAEINVGCLTQCIKARTLMRLNDQTTLNILLKVNSKLNGTNHILSTRPPIMNKPCMIMGADVTHPSPDARDIPSVAAVTASHDPKAFKYNICWRLQPPKVEIIEDLEAITKEQLLYFYQNTKVKPERIVFFRDGVSEGQFEQVRHAEIRAIRAACKKLQQDGYEPAITFLVVQKRHHTRLFPMDPRDSEDRNVNVPAGTCVDSKITHPFMQDFYLVSHASIQGVAKPTKYCTLWDDNNMTNDDIEELTYYLCHMFTRCNRSVSYPAPTYYAHLAAARAKVYIEHERLNMSQLQREFDKFQIQDNIRKGLPMFFV